MRPADFTAVLFGVALFLLILFARTPQLVRLLGSDAGWLAIIVTILGFFGLGTVLHSLVQAYRIQLRAHRLKNR